MLREYVSIEPPRITDQAVSSLTIMRFIETLKSIEQIYKTLVGF